MSFDRSKPWTEESERKLAKQLSGFAVRNIFQEGVELFRAGFVEGGTWESGNTYSAELSLGTINYAVTISFGFLPFSRCSCGIKGSCAHMIAAVCAALHACDVPVFDLIRKYGLASPVGDRAEGAAASSARLHTAAAAKTQPNSEALQKKQTSLQSAKTTLSGMQSVSAESDLPTPWDGYRKWHRQFERKMPEYSQPLAQFAKWVEHHLLRTSLNWVDEERKALYRVHVWLYAFRLADRSFSHPRYAFEAFGNGIQDLVKRFHEALIDHASIAQISDRLNEDMEGLRAIVGEYGFESVPSYVDWVDTYRGLWSRYPPEPHEIIREKKRLKEMIEGQEDSIRRIKAVLGMIHMILLEQGPEAATAYMEEHWRGRPSEFYGYLMVYSRSENWRYLNLWLDKLAGLASRNGSEEDVEDLLYFWELMAKATLSQDERAEQRRKFMMRLLPRGFHSYAELLVKEGDFEGWVDLHLAYDELPDESDGYKIVERKAPEHLLPVYHFYAVQWIETRKRDGYRNAVAHLERLRKLYGKLKQQDLWNDYIYKLLERYSRLSALHEEVRKGHLISK